MKCARGLIAISLKVEELRRLERERRAAEALRILKERTINWCENIGEILEKKAIDAQPLEYEILLMKSIEEGIYYTIEEVSSRYCDNRKDYNVNWYNTIHLSTVIEFFEKYCFEIILEKPNYLTYSYGVGCIDTRTLTIKPAPQCF